MISQIQGALANFMANLALLLPFGFAFGAGMVATVNPCGFLLLPSYLAYYLGTEEPGFLESSLPLRIIRALALGAIITLGFVVLFSVAGLVIALGGQGLLRFSPWVGIVIGLALAGLGLALLFTPLSLGIRAVGRSTGTPRRGLRNTFLFGITYGAGSLGCTLPIFLAVVGSALARQGLGLALLQFLLYSLGMGSVIVVVIMGAALFKGASFRFLRSFYPHFHRLSALFMVGAGAYLVYYWIKSGLVL